jgi:hypothetical protein
MFVTELGSVVRIRRASSCRALWQGAPRRVNMLQKIVLGLVMAGLTTRGPSTNGSIRTAGSITDLPPRQADAKIWASFMKKRPRGRG